MAKKPKSAAVAEGDVVLTATFPRDEEIEPDIPATLLLEANSFVFPNGERNLDDPRVEKLARELMETKP